VDAVERNMTDTKEEESLVSFRESFQSERGKYLYFTDVNTGCLQTTSFV